MKTVRIHPASKIRQRDLLKPSIPEFSNGTVSVSIGNHFWNTVLSSQFFKAQTSERPELGLENARKTELSGQLERAVRLFQSALEKSLSNEDFTFCFRIFSQVLETYRKIFPNWDIRLSSALLHEANAFDENTIDFSFDAIGRARGDTFFQKTVMEAYDWDSIRDSVVIFDFFWPAELLQIFAISQKLKERGNVVIIDATEANEQGDQTQWIETFKKDPRIFSYFDYFIAYQDYGIALWKLIECIELDNWSETETIANVAFLKKDGTVSFQKPEARKIGKDELFSAFEKHSFERNDGWKFLWENVAALRMVPFKCHWSGCYFCTINSTHVFPYDPGRTEMPRYISRLVKFLKDQKISLLSFQDEALRPDDIGLFATAVKEAGLSNFHYRFRTRFSKEYTPEFCRFLAESGATFVGVWLECASERIDALINKGSGLTLLEKEEIISNFESAGIAFHAYAIFGLPTESIVEMRDTFVFLRHHLENGRNFGCTPNTFWLNRGSEMYRNPEKFGLLPDTIDKSGTLDLRANRRMDETSFQIQQRFISELLRIEFLPFMPEGGQVPNAYWKYADYGRFYYFLRGNANRENLFRKRWNASKKLLSMEFPELLKIPFQISPYLEIREESPGAFRVQDLGTFSSIGTSPDEAAFLRAFDPRMSLAESLSEFPLESPPDSVRKFITAGILYETP